LQIDNLFRIIIIFHRKREIYIIRLYTYILTFAYYDSD